MNFPGLDPAYLLAHHAAHTLGLIKTWTLEETRHELHDGERVLIVATTALGDTILTTPLVDTLSKGLFPEHVSMLVKSPYVELYQRDPRLHRVFSVRGKYRWGSLRAKLEADPHRIALLANMTEPDLVPFLARCGVRGFLRYRTRWSRYPRWMANASMLRRPSAPDYATGHAIENNLAMAKALGVDPSTHRLSLSHLRAEPATRENLVLIHPGASREIKRWPVENWAAVADALVDKFGCAIALTGDRGEHSLAALIATKMRARPQILAGKLSLTELAHLQSRALLFLSGDTGPFHLAVSVECPTVTLFAPTDRGSSVEACGPHQAPSKFHRALQTARLGHLIDTIPVVRVIAEAASVIETSIAPKLRLRHRDRSPHFPFLMRLLYLYPEEWTGRRAQEIQTLASCVALAVSGVEVTLVTAGGEQALHAQLVDLANATVVPGLNLVPLSRKLGPVQSTSIFSRNFTHWMKNREPFDLAFIIHLKAGAILSDAEIPFVYEAHGIFTPMQQSASRQRLLHKVEAQVLGKGVLHIATSAPLAVALITWFGLSKDFAIVPNAGLRPLEKSISAPDGPFVYCGSIALGHDLANIVEAARDAQVPLKIIGGTEEEWHLAGNEFDTTGIDWQPHVPISQLPEFLAGARAGVIPTNPDSPAGEFSCPLKLFEYARCGLPVISTELPSLQSLDVGPWCTQIPSPARLSWIEAIQNFHHDPAHAEDARAWAGLHTWDHRAGLLKGAFEFLKE